jgi:hypothetical protein
MEASLLVQKLNERGITLKLVGGELTCDSAQPIPKAIMTTINAEKKQLVTFLKGTVTVEQPTILASADDTDTHHPAPTTSHAEKPAPSPAATNDTLSRLPWQLERLVSAASSGQLSVELSGVPDSTRYVMGWACSYLTGDQAEALRRLWEVRRAWQPEGVN